MIRARFAVFAFILVASLLCFAYKGDGKWLQHVPDKERTRSNPFAADTQAHQAGAKLYEEHCSSCHGGDATGRYGDPALVSSRVQHATDGELQWLLRNGSLVNGMPSWSSLPEQQRWQIVTYLRDLQQIASLR